MTESRPSDEEPGVSLSRSEGASRQSSRIEIGVSNLVAAISFMLLVAIVPIMFNLVTPLREATFDTLQWPLAGVLGGIVAVAMSFFLLKHFRAMQSVVFVAHAFEDTAMARALAQRLEADGFRVLTAESNIRLGENIELSVMQLIDKARCVIFLISPSFVASPWLYRELAIAGDSKRFVVPLVVRGTPVPKQLEKLRFIEIDAIDVTSYAEIRRLLPIRPSGLAQKDR